MTGVIPLDRWHAVDRRDRDLATGRAPSSLGAPSAAAALAAAPVIDWPVCALAADGRRWSLAAALGGGGAAVERLLDELMAGPDRASGLDMAALAAAGPAGRLDLPLAVVPLSEAVERSAGVDPAWLAAVEHRRAAARGPLLAAGRSDDLEAALHVTMLVATEVLDPPAAGDVDAHVASGAQLWLLAGAAAWCLAADAGVHAGANPFAPWARLVTAGWWPVGPSAGELVMAVAPR